MKHYYINTLFSARRSLCLAVLSILLGFTSSVNATEWVPLAKDDLHDPNGPGVALLQEPSEGLNGLPPDKAGNMVNWIQAITQGVISPRRFESQTGDVPPMQEPEMILDKGGSMPMVLFPHKLHTVWLECSNCHPDPFVPKAGANKIRMQKILGGEQCGLCHGKVAFPPTNCSRCHSIKYPVIQ